MFYGVPVIADLTPSETTIDQLEDIGIFVHIPESTVETSSIQIRPCFSGPFKLPDDYEPASPAYLICHSRKFKNDITISIQHYVNLQTQKDCENMAFLSACSTPQYTRESCPVYTFNFMHDAREMFKPDSLVGNISLQHFCLITAGKRKNEESSNKEMSSEEAESLDEEDKETSDKESSDESLSSVSSCSKLSSKKHQGCTYKYGLHV